MTIDHDHVIAKIQKFYDYLKHEIQMDHDVLLSHDMQGREKDFLKVELQAFEAILDMYEHMFIEILDGDDD